MQTIRCKECNRILMQIDIEGKCTIKEECSRPKCKKYNLINIKDNKIIEHSIIEN